MCKLNHKLFLFGIGLFVIFLVGFAIPMNSYENNHLINSPQGSYSRLILSKKSFKKIKPEKNEFFKYYSDNKENMSCISHIEKNNNKYILVLRRKPEIEPFKTISYKLSRTNIWNEIFSFLGN